jgi:methylated-DNA-[protein]-cysteine S-methyltransferase
MKQITSQETQYYFKTMKSPVGELKLIASDKGLVGILWERDNPQRIQVQEYSKSNTQPILVKAEKELKEYFAKKRKKFTLKLDFLGTEFQQQVWAALLTIPCGETRSYADIAKQIGKPTAVRAVGTAIGKNPISVIAPCHRVIASSGKLAGFAGGLVNKKILLELESKK